MTSKPTSDAALTPAAAPVPVVSAPADDAQPARFPVEFDEWAHGQTSLRRTLVAGFRHEMRMKGELQKRQTFEAWNAAFAEFTGGGR